MAAAADAEAAMEAVARVAEPSIVGGTVRISASEGFGAAILAPTLPALHAAYPNLRIELAAQTGFLSPSKREVDVVVTLTAPKGARIVAEPLTDYDLALYASPAYLKRRGAPQSVDELSAHDFVGYVDDLLFSEELRYLETIAPNVRPVLSSSSIRAQYEIVLNGGGIAVLPCFLARQTLRPILPHVRLTRRWWLGTHRDVIDNARTRVVHQWLKDTVAARRTDLTPPRTH
ncbi:MAG: LysR substrate-binding domain-containing protein [Hyphomonadaceae bacterium]